MIAVALIAAVLGLAAVGFVAWLLFGYEPDPDDRPAYDEAAVDPLNAGINGALGFPNVIRWRHRRPRPEETP